MSTAAVASAVPVDLVPTLADDSRTTVDAAAALKDEALASHAAELKAGKNGDEVSKDALYKLVDVIGTKTAEFVSRDLLLAHTLLLSHFHHQLRDGDNEAKDLAFLCAAETRYIAYLDAVAKAAIKDKALVDALPLPPMDVAMFLHSHMLSPLRFADDMTRRYGPTFVGLSLPLVRLAKAASGGSKDDLETGRAFWAKYLPANMPYSFTPADVDETKAVGRVSCPLCKSELVLSVAEYAALRLHGRAHECMSCACNFTAEHMAVCRFLTMVMNAPLARIAGTQSHPKTRQPMPMHSGNMADLAMLFDQGEWAKYGAALPQLATWADVENMIMVPIMKASAGSLNLPGNRRRFAMVIHAHQDVTTGPWAMDMVRAVRRQRRFSANIARTVQSGMGGVYHFHTKALVQYPKFLAMIVAHPGTSIVPTPEIDLAWHTHQLSPLVYGMHGCALMGCILNHDDSDDAETKAVIADGAKETAELWMHDFGEDYFNLRLPCADGAKYQATETALINHVAHAAHTTQHADCRSYRGGSEAAAMTPDADVSGFCRMCVPDWGANKANSASDASGFCRIRYCWDRICTFRYLDSFIALSRHRKCTMVMSVQHFKAISPLARNNMNYYVLFET
ncbi:hypothetical protein GGF31_006911 [Allomyces arbusculus]|nr:hypothetical protein GGF31_006911 [Allomyces arbusculus]